MAATIVVTAGANVRTFNITTANQERIITAIERSNIKREPDGSTFEVDGEGNLIYEVDGEGNLVLDIDGNPIPIPIPAQNDFDYFNLWLKRSYSDLLYRTERRAKGLTVPYDENAIDTP